MKFAEDTLQINCVIWFKLQYPKLLIHHSPNGGKRDAREAARFKTMGTVSGFPDLFIPIAKHGFHGLFIEMKAGSNKLTKNQHNVISILKESGYKCEVCYNLDEFMKVVNEYLK
jgi:hypothetical protein